MKTFFITFQKKKEQKLDIFIREYVFLCQPDVRLILPKSVKLDEVFLDQFEELVRRYLLMGQRDFHCSDLDFQLGQQRFKYLCPNQHWNLHSRDFQIPFSRLKMHLSKIRRGLELAYNEKIPRYLFFGILDNFLEAEVRDQIFLVNWKKLIVFLLLDLDGDFDRNDEIPREITQEHHQRIRQMQNFTIGNMITGSINKIQMHMHIQRNLGSGLQKDFLGWLNIFNHISGIQNHYFSRERQNLSGCIKRYGKPY